MEMEKKYKLTDETLNLGNKVLHRIQALRDICGGLVKKGDIGGWIEKEDNLSHEGNCWVNSNAKVLDNAIVKGNARITDCAMVVGNSIICGYAFVYGNAIIADNAKISDQARILDQVYIGGNAIISDLAMVHDRAKVYGNSKVYGSARVGGCAILSGDAVVSQCMKVVSGYHIKVDLSDRKNIRQNLIAQCGLLDCDGKVTCYKLVNGDLSSNYDSNFKYKVGEWAIAENPKMNDDPCASGLHFGASNYNVIYTPFEHLSTYLIAEVDLDDIITIQEGKIRCKKAFIKGVVKL